MKQHIREKLKLVPELPGSYQMKNKDGIIIYVGKAKNLKNRLKSYFTGLVTGKTAMLVADIVDFEYIVTSTELESLILEITLIKKYNPKYNILLKDDKSYPYIELTDEKYPRLRIVRNVNRKRHKSRLFGPYPNVGAARKTVNMLNRIYPLRKCETLKKEVCLYYHIGECLGYCQKKIDEAEQKEMMNEIVSFLKGNNEIIIKRLKEDMERASEALNFEKALELKNMLNDIDITLTKQKIDLNKNYQFDLFGFHQDKNYLSVTVFFIREGLLFGKQNDIFNSVDQLEEDLTHYIIQFYEKNHLLPKEILVPDCVDSTLLSEYLNCKVSVPKRGALKKLLDLACENASLALTEKYENIEREESNRLQAEEELRELLHLPKLERIEAFDNSHLFGTFYVGGMVVFDHFLPNKNEYRKFKISTDVKDDLSAMKEVIYRRYFRVLMEEFTAPDLILVDGGELQISAAREIIDQLHLSIPIAGLKKNDQHKTNVLVNQDLEEIPLPKDSHLFLFLNRIQDEVHRYAISYHRNIKSKGALASLLDMAPGIGEVRKHALLKKFGSLKKMKEASLEELETVLNHDVAVKFFEYLKEL
ncbi:MAG TPA: excinuclease ABC subunit UvrC [Candidatus Scybalousia intestinigallinarum]|nr:excinuclease ABC subunit UvrC [Candidatus Scybalousia intestinigallinarum]